MANMFESVEQRMQYSINDVGINYVSTRKKIFDLNLISYTKINF